MKQGPVTNPDQDVPKSTMRRRLYTIDALRGIAALAVLLGHIRHHKRIVTIDLRFWLLFPLDFGYLGVALFLVISSFCIHLRAARQLQQSDKLYADWRSFWWRRFYRLYPPYLAAMGLAIGIYYFATPAARAPWQHIVSLLPDLLTHLLLIHNLFVDYSYGLGNSAFWTLGLEEQLYALYALYLLLRRFQTAKRTLLFVAVVSLAWRIGVVLHATSWPSTGSEAQNLIFKWSDWPFCYWFLWVLGAVAAEAYVGAWQLPRWCYQYRSALLLAMVAFTINPLIISRLLGSHYLTSKLGSQPYLEAANFVSPASNGLFAIAFFIVLNVWVRAEREGVSVDAALRILSRVGTFSYSLYLTHLPIIVLGETLVPTGDSVQGLIFRFVVYVPLTAGFTWLFFVAVERWFLHPPTRLPWTQTGTVDVLTHP